MLGAGVMGLTTARLVQEAGFPVTIYAKALPPDTTSNIAGGQWQPFGHYRDDAVTPEWRAQFAAALDYSWRRFQIMVGDDYGIRWLPTYVEHRPATTSGPLRSTPTIPAAACSAPAEHPFPLGARSSASTRMYVETGRFLRQLTRDVQIAGGTIRVRDFATPADIAALARAAGLQLHRPRRRALFGDTGMQPVRGQLAILLPQPEIRYAFTGEAGYMFPRADGILLGGTFERDVWETDAGAAKRSPASSTSHQRLFGGFRCTT